jgi:hypothetical protein
MLHAEDVRTVSKTIGLNPAARADGTGRCLSVDEPLTSFLGREEDLARPERLLGQARLVTLTGTGGAGKTRLAAELGARLVPRCSACSPPSQAGW